MDPEEIKKRKLQEMMAQQQGAAQQEAQEQQQMQQLESMVKQHLTKDALARYGNIKAANPELGLHIIAVVAQGIQQNQIGMVNDEMLRNLLKRIDSLKSKKEFNIKRK